MKSVKLLVMLIVLFTVFNACKRTGCRQDVLCVDNYDPKAKADGQCSGCTTFGAANYCPEATKDNNLCVFTRKLYSDYSTEGWIDVWVADSTDDALTPKLTYEGRIVHFHTNIPECEEADSTLNINRRPGTYYYEIETKTGKLEWGNMVFREEGCRLMDVY